MGSFSQLAAAGFQPEYPRLQPVLRHGALANPDPELRINPFTDVRAEGAPDQSALWEAMAVAIIFGLVFATALTLGVVPILYSLFYRVRYDGVSS